MKKGAPPQPHVPSGTPGLQTLLRPSDKLAVKFLRFWSFGLPMFLAGIALNLLLVRGMHMYKPLAYVFVLAAQTSVNFAFCNWFVFQTNGRLSWMRFLEFVALILLFRSVEWCAYALLVTHTSIPFLVLQACLMGTLAIPKFITLRMFFEGRERARQKP